jgi:hypothetical protein
MTSKIVIFSKQVYELSTMSGVISHLSIEKINQQFEIFGVNSTNNKALFKEALSTVTLTRTFQFVDSTVACQVTKQLISEFGCEIIPISTSLNRTLDLLSNMYKKKESLARISELLERNIDNFMLIFIV